MFMKKTIIYSIISFICGISFTVGASYLYSAKDIEYTNANTNVNNLEDALNEIYSTGDASASDIRLDKSALVNGKKIIGSYIPDLEYYGAISAGGAFNLNQTHTNSINVEPGHYLLIYDLATASDNSGANHYKNSLYTGGTCKDLNGTASYYHGTSHNHYAALNTFDCIVTSNTTYSIKIIKTDDTWLSYSASARLILYKYK